MATIRPKPPIIHNELLVLRNLVGELSRVTGSGVKPFAPVGLRELAVPVISLSAAWYDVIPLKRKATTATNSAIQRTDFGDVSNEDHIVLGVADNPILATWPTKAHARDQSAMAGFGKR